MFKEEWFRQGSGYYSELPRKVSPEFTYKEDKNLVYCSVLPYNRFVFPGNYISRKRLKVAFAIAGPKV